MRRSSEWKTNALILLSALGLAALYGGATGLTLWMFNFSDAAEIGGLVSTVTGGLALIVAFFMIIYNDDNRSQKPARWVTLPFLIVTYVAFRILLLPPIILTLGRFWRWISNIPKQEEENQ